MVDSFGIVNNFNALFVGFDLKRIAFNIVIFLFYRNKTNYRLSTSIRLRKYYVLNYNSGINRNAGTFVGNYHRSVFGCDFDFGHRLCGIAGNNGSCHYHIGFTAMRLVFGILINIRVFRLNIVIVTEIGSHRRFFINLSLTLLLTFGFFTLCNVKLNLRTDGLDVFRKLFHVRIVIVKLFIKLSLSSALKLSRNYDNNKEQEENEQNY